MKITGKMLEVDEPSRLNPSKGALAAALLLVHVCMLVLATPGLDDLGARTLRSDADRTALRAQAGEPWASLGIAITDFNRGVRMPVVEALNPLEHVFRIKQSWNLYRGGPQRITRMEVRVDGALVYRSVDSEHRWLQAQLASRRLRPMVEAVARKRKNPNWRGLVRYIAQNAAVDFPGAQKVEVHAVAGPFPAGPLETTRRYVATAPDWEPTKR